MKKKKNNITRYNKYQKYISSFCKKNNIKLGKKFGAYTSEVYQKTKDVSLKDVKKSTLVYRILTLSLLVNSAVICLLAGF